jgi:hypothetical protein
LISPVPNTNDQDQKMKHFQFCFAFALGCLLSLFIGRIAVSVGAQGQKLGQVFAYNIHVCIDKDDVMHVVVPIAICPSGQRSARLKYALADVDSDKPPKDTSLDTAKVEGLNRRLSRLDEMGCAAFRKNKVVAPFEVVDRSGKRIFSVIENAAGLFNGGNYPAATFMAEKGGGLFKAQGGDMRVSFGISAPRLAGVTVTEKDQPRIEIGKSLITGAYKSVFLSASGQLIAGVGESPSSKAGAVLINNAQGNQRAIMEVTDNGRGRVGIMSGSGKPIVALTEGESGGGVFYVCAAGGNCDPVMVSAGTNESGVGVVATGPRFYISGPTGAPGSFLIGKKQ